MDRLSGQRRRFGMEAETLAMNFLRKKGLWLLTRNYHSRHGEIDLIVRNRGTIIFVEVRFRKSRHFGTAIESVTQAKRSRIIKTARHFLMCNPKFADFDFRFDIIGISENGDQEGYRIEWLENAFS